MRCDRDDQLQKDVEICLSIDRVGKAGKSRVARGRRSPDKEMLLLRAMRHVSYDEVVLNSRDYY